MEIAPTSRERKYRRQINKLRLQVHLSNGVRKKVEVKKCRVHCFLRIAFVKNHEYFLLLGMLAVYSLFHRQLDVIQANSEKARCLCSIQNISMNVNVNANVFTPHFANRFQYLSPPIPCIFISLVVLLHECVCVCWVKLSWKSEHFLRPIFRGEYPCTTSNSVPTVISWLRFLHVKIMWIYDMVFWCLRVARRSDKIFVNRFQSVCSV